MLPLIAERRSQITDICRRFGVRRLAVFGFGIFLLAGARSVLDWQWGQVESSGIRLVQPIPKGALPSRQPATLHVRVASPLMPPAAHFEILGPGSRPLYSSAEDPARQRHYVTISLPD